MDRRPVIGVMGGHDVDEQTMEQAAALGRAIAAEGWILLNGGRDEGVMRASAQAARAAGGFVVGVHPGVPGDHAADVDLCIYTGVGFARNSINVLSSDVVVALPGASGTLTEVAYALGYARPIILYGFDDKEWFGDRVQRVPDLDTCLDAIRTVLDDRAA